jgi:hypothetical protein
LFAEAQTNFPPNAIEPIRKSKKKSKKSKPLIPEAVVVPPSSYHADLASLIHREDLFDAQFRVGQGPLHPRFILASSSLHPRFILASSSLHPRFILASSSLHPRFNSLSECRSTVRLHLCVYPRSGFAEAESSARFASFASFDAHHRSRCNRISLLLC